MPTSQPVHPRHADLVALLEDYLAERGRSARWLGLTVANDPRLLPNLRRGQHYPVEVRINLARRMVEYYSAQSATEKALEGDGVLLAA